MFFLLFLELYLREMTDYEWTMSIPLFIIWLSYKPIECCKLHRTIALQKEKNF